MLDRAARLFAEAGVETVEYADREVYGGEVVLSD